MGSKIVFILRVKVNVFEVRTLVLYVAFGNHGLSPINTLVKPENREESLYRIPKRPCAPETMTSNHIHPWSNLGLDNDGNILLKGN